MSSVTIQNVTKSFGNTVVLENFDAVFQNGEFITLLGPSGCGKTTMLRIIAGFEKPTSGCVKFDERVVSSDKVFIPPEKRDIGMVFQSYAVWPHMTVFDNVAYPLRIKKMDKDVIQKKVDRVLAMVHLTQYAQRIPSQLSGGQQQRVALARALVAEPALLLLDEPLSNLDAKLRAQMRTELTKIHKRLGTTFIYVTHDQVEAMTMATRIVVMKEGVIQQVDTPQNLYDNPKNIFVAGFIGTPQMNFINSRLERMGDDLIVKFGQNIIKLPEDKANDPDLKEYINSEVVLGIRPECIHDEPMYLTQFPDSIIECNVDVTELMGAEIYLYLSTGDTNLVARVSPRSTARSGDKIKVALDVSRMHVFDKETEKCIVH